MTIPIVDALADRVRTHAKANTLDISDAPMTIPAKAFLDVDRFERERALFARSPHVIGWASEVARPGDYITRDVMGYPVLVTRAKDGGLHAFINGCMHRGAAVASGCGHAAKFVCPYHAWTYDLDGSLSGVPERGMFDGIDLSVRSLRRLPVSDRCGLLTVGLSDGVDLDGYLDGLDVYLDALKLSRCHFNDSRRFEVKANWKLTVGINLEGYHFKFLHRKTLDPLATNNSIYDLLGRHAFWAFPSRDLECDENSPPSWPLDVNLSIALIMFPGVVLLDSPSATLLLRIYPGKGPDESIFHIESATVAPVETDADREMAKYQLGMTCAVLAAEDIPQAEACQQGLKSGVPDVVVGRNEPVLRHFAEQWNAAVGELV